MMVPRFFEYDDTFTAWLIKYAERRLIVDIGCGSGHLIRALVLAGHERVAGIELRAVVDADVEPRTIIADATQSRLCSANGVLLVLARPCHGGWIERVLERATSEVLFVGRPSRLHEDLGAFASKATRLDVPGVHQATDGEEIGVWSVRRPKARERVWLVEVRGSLGWFDRRTRLGPKGEDWTEESDGLGYWTTGLGAGFPVSPTDKIIEGPTLVRSDIEIDWSRCEWVRQLMERAPHGPEGWISPWGAFYGCAYREHDKLAYYGLGYQVGWLEELGWARLQKSPTDPSALFAYRHDDNDLTLAQRAVEKAIAAKFNLKLY